MKNRLLLFILFNAFIIQAQKIKNQIIENSIEIKTISPFNTDYSDLNVIGKAIGNSKVVMLGEQGHGDAPTFIAKTRIIKYLHEKKGFDIIAFESDFFGLNQCNNKNLKRNIYSIWSDCEQNQEIFEYLNQNPSLIVKGFDIRHHSEYSKNNYIIEFEKMLSNANFNINDKSYIKFKNILTELIEKEYNSEYKNNMKVKEYFFNFLNEITKLVEAKTFENSFFWKQELNNLKVYAINSWLGGDRIDGNRDKQMGNNIIWLIKKKYPNKKIIVWAHSAHIANEFSKMEKKSYLSAGEIVKHELENDAYILGFSSYQGKAGRITRKKYDIPKPIKNSFENWMNSKDYKYAFVNFNQIKNSKRFYMSGLFHFSSKYNWISVFDGVFYIKDMYPCKRVTKPNNQYNQ